MQKNPNAEYEYVAKTRVFWQDSRLAQKVCGIIREHLLIIALYYDYLFYICILSILSDRHLLLASCSEETEELHERNSDWRKMSEGFADDVRDAVQKRAHDLRSYVTSQVLFARSHNGDRACFSIPCKCSLHVKLTPIVILHNEQRRCNGC